jgi:hypothetical protein
VAWILEKKVAEVAASALQKHMEKKYRRHNEDEYGEHRKCYYIFCSGIELEPHESIPF